MSNFKTGDRVVFVEKYRANKIGDKGIIVRQKDVTTDCVIVKTDSGISTVCFESRLRLDSATPAAAFKVGDKGITEAGQKYEVLGIFPLRPKSILADVDGSVREFYPSGKVTLLGKSGFDLIAKKSTVTTFVNVYSEGYSTGHPTLHAARVAANLGVLLVGYELTVELL